MTLMRSFATNTSSANAPQKTSCIFARFEEVSVYGKSVFLRLFLIVRKNELEAVDSVRFDFITAPERSK